MDHPATLATDPASDPGPSRAATNSARLPWGGSVLYAVLRSPMARSLALPLSVLLIAACVESEAPAADREAPVVAGVDVAETRLEAGDTLDIRIDARDAAGIARILITIATGAETLQCDAARLTRIADAERWACQLPVPLAATGTWSIAAINAEDVAGNQATIVPAHAASIEITAPAIAAVRIRGEHVVSMLRGDSTRIAADALDARGNPIARAVAFEWSSADASTARITPVGSIHAPMRAGGTWIFATSGVARDSLRIWVQPRPTDANPFRITLVYSADVPQYWRTALDSAVLRWQEVVRDDLEPFDLGALSEETLRRFCPIVPDAIPAPRPTGVERGVRIEVVVGKKFPEATYVEAVGGPCIARPLPKPTTAYGRVSLNFDKFAAGTAPHRLRYVAVHEIGHVLGLVATSPVGTAATPWWNALALTYTGVMGLEGLYRTTGERASRISFASGMHWKEQPDIMSARTGPDITALSIGALMDVGYPAVWYAGGSY